MQVEIEKKKKIVISLSEFVKEHEDLEESLVGKFWSWRLNAMRGEKVGKLEED